jgi:ammonium transporter, Amt family
MSSGAAGLAYALVLGKRKKSNEKHLHKPHNVTITFLGTCLIWFGWFGFNGGSAINASIRAMAAIFNTQVAASTGCIGYSLVGYFKNGRKFSVIVACEGIIAGLVGITPAAGFVTIWYAAAIGFLTALACSALDGMHEWLGIDDGLEVFKLHGVGGACGAFLTGIFATQSVSALDGIPTLASGAVDGNGVQVAKQLAEIAAILSWSFVVSVIMLFALKFTPLLHLRVDDEIEELGVDLDQFNDELIGEWSNFTIEENGYTQGLTAKQARASVSGPQEGTMTPPMKEETKAEAPKETV